MRAECANAIGSGICSRDIRLLNKLVFPFQRMHEKMQKSPQIILYTCMYLKLRLFFLPISSITPYYMATCKVVNFYLLGS